MSVSVTQVPFMAKHPAERLRPFAQVEVAVAVTSRKVEIVNCVSVEVAAVLVAVKESALTLPAIMAEEEAYRVEGIQTGIVVDGVRASAA